MLLRERTPPTIRACSCCSAARSLHSFATEQMVIWPHEQTMYNKFIDLSVGVLYYIYIYTISCIVRLKALVSYHENVP